MQFGRNFSPEPP